MRNPNKKISGFTLIEMSIVLVVIGLIIGGVLSGRALIDTARKQAFLAQIEGYRVAVPAFEMKYDALPGDMTNATSYWSGTVDGDGDLKIGRSTPLTVFYRREKLLAWQHLALAEMVFDAPEGVISGNSVYVGRNTPEIKGIKGYDPANSIIELVYASRKAMNRTSLETRHIMTSEDAWAIDKKLDDGANGSGNIRVYDDWGSNTCTTGNGNPGNATWLFGSGRKSCRLIFGI